MKNITNGKVLILSDIHQSIGGYVEPILEKETDWDYIILNGDYLDTLQTPDGSIIYGVTQTCAWINEKFEEWGDNAIWHIGNHDVSYLASYNKDYIKTRPNPYYFCSGWTRNKAKYFNKEINPNWIDKLSLCTQLGKNTIVSHAGFHYNHFKPYKSELDNIKELSEKWDNEKKTFHIEPWHWIWDVGRFRCGAAIVGSPVWMDWSEFVPIDNIQQVVGHSTTRTPSIRCKENGKKIKNYCIDCMQQTYAIWENGKLEIKQLSGEKLINFDDHQTRRLD
jgi:hypothetical protein